MLEHLHAITLRIVRHNDKMSIADVLTRERGRMSFALRLPAIPKKNSYLNLWRNLNMLEFDADLRETDRLAYPKNVCSYHIYNDLPYNPLKTMVSMFVNELLTETVRGEMTDIRLYDFVEQSLMLLDALDKTDANFHIAFAVKLICLLGVEPSVEQEPGQNYYDLQTAGYTDFVPIHKNFLKDDEANFVKSLLRITYRNMSRFKFSRTQRRRVLEVINEYCMIHIHGFRALKSLAVLQETLS